MEQGLLGVTPEKRGQALPGRTHLQLSEDPLHLGRVPFPEGEVVELMAAIGLFNYFNRFNDLLQMEPTKPASAEELAQVAEAHAVTA